MPKITRLKLIESIKAGDPPQVDPDGTILNPEPYHGCDVELDDGIAVQVERPVTIAKIQAAWQAVRDNPVSEVDGVSEGDMVPLGP